MSKLLDTCGRWGDKMGKLARDKLRAAKTACKCFSCRSMEGNDDAEYGPYPYPEKSMFRDGDLKASTALNARLLSPQAATPKKLKDSNINCHNCHNCTGCIGCDNCNDCTGCISCHECNNCHGCVRCTNCNNCNGVIDGHNQNCVTNSCGKAGNEKAMVKSKPIPAIGQAPKLKDSNVNCHNCHNCTGCIDCNDCNDCGGCITCNQCNKCTGCITCTNCKNCKGIINGHNRNCVTNSSDTKTQIVAVKSHAKAAIEQAPSLASSARLGKNLSTPIGINTHPANLKDSNINCHNCQNCTGCIDCNNCNDCTGCINCDTCNRCRGCIRCTHCNNCVGVIDGHNRNCVTSSSETKTDIGVVKSNANAAIKQASSASSAHLGKKISTSTAPATTLLTGIVPHAAPKDSNVNCHNCHNCKGCIDCNDCNGCAGCINCNKCNKCEGCIRCVNCKNCIGVIDGHNRNCVTGKAKTGATVTELKQRNPDTKATCGNYLTQ
ncbi:hypothetical protein ABMA27_008709 [Loxostege sticticalis]|uniref:Uncharacterized protein n=1 Tax=Loxostege sticticalis TaxID=481309 RepID=A0ABR3HCC2_LOXSC